MSFNLKDKVKSNFIIKAINKPVDYKKIKDSIIKDNGLNLLKRFVKYFI